MFKTKWSIVLALALCALLLPITGTGKDQVERPFKLHGENTVIADLEGFILHGNPVCPYWTESESGEATHLGRYTSEGGGTINLATGVVTGSGYVTAANGDELFWEMTIQMGAPAGVVTFTGGTGRFAGASGLWTETVTDESVVLEGYLLTIEHSLSGVGTITY